VRRCNLLEGELPQEQDRPGFRTRRSRVGASIGSEQIGASVYEIPEGETTFPYHYHHGVEEWVVVIDGTPTVRTPDGERVLRRGDVVCFPSGREGAHAVRGPGRVMILSANRAPSIAVYPDSDKVGTRPEGGVDRLDFRRGDAVDYWDGEGGGS
jgi:uncharacterized cupin superfamily protein